MCHTLRIFSFSLLEYYIVSRNTVYTRVSFPARFRSNVANTLEGLERLMTEMKDSREQVRVASDKQKVTESTRAHNYVLR